MYRRIFLTLTALAFVACASVNPDTYKRTNSNYSRDDGIFLDSSNNMHFISNGSTVGNVDTNGAITMADVTTTDDVVVGDDLTVTDDTVLTDDVEINGVITLENDATIDNANNGAIEINEASEELILTFTSDDVAVTSGTGIAELDLGTINLETDEIDANGTGTLTVLVNGENVVLTGSTNTMTMSSGTGTDTFAFGNVGITASAPALLLDSIRFCGNGPDGGTETFVSPVPFDDTEADFIDGGAGCDAEDDTTIGNADEAWPVLKDVAFKPVAMVCTAACTGATAANDAIVFKLYDDTVAVADMTCTTSALGGNGVAAQCTVTDTSPATIAAGSAIAIGIDNTDDDCNDAGDDFSCLLYVTF